MGWRIIWASLASMVIFMIWGTVFWSLPFVQAHVSAPFPGDNTALIAALKASLPGAGVYFLPSPQAILGGDPAAQASPLLHLFYHPQGWQSSMGMIFTQGALHALATSFIMVVLVCALPAKTRSFTANYRFISLASLLPALAALADAIWWFHPWSYSLINALYLLVGWLLAGVAIAWFLGRGQPSGSL
jgi:hypothetical protein